MAAPIIKTPKGNLGTIQEQEFYELNIQVVVPNDPTPDLNFKIIAGALPPGIVLNETTGYLNGRPKELYRFRGVPFDVAEDVTSTFCVRVTNLRSNQITDRTFSLTVTGQDAPTIVNTIEDLGQVFDGEYAEFQITAIDLDREQLTYYISNGDLPPGLTINKNTGIISGVVEPTDFFAVGASIGWSTDIGWDDNPWDYAAKFLNKRYQFDISVSDTKDITTKSFSIFVISKDSLTADNSVIAINGYYDTVTADVDNKRTPVLTLPSSDLGVYSHSNYFAYQFTAVDYDFDQIGFSLLIEANIGYDNYTNGFDSAIFDVGESELPPGLTLSEETGWLYGYLGNIGSLQKEYQFGVYVYKRNYPEYRSEITQFKLTLIGNLRNVLTWQSPSFLGTITAGEVSELYIEATNVFNKKLNYSLQIGSNSRLPQGLRLLDNGLIVGRASFEVTSFDKNTLTFDKEVKEIGAILPETTFDKDHTFTVKVNDIDNFITTYKTFTIKLLSNYNRPYESLYLRAQPGLEDKEIYNQLVYNSDIIPNEYVYRNGDPYFGKQKNLDVLVLSGINPSTASEYVQAMAINHYRKKLLLGQPEIAKARDANGNVKYEVLYLPMKDDNGTLSKSIDLRTKINRVVTVDSENPEIDLNYFTINGYDRIIYPNSLQSMRNQIKNDLGFVDREVLPLWMKSKQDDGLIPYYKPAMVLAYLKPGTGDQVKFLINRIFNDDLKKISFDVDRYIWDCNLSKNYNAVTNSYIDSNLTTFDADIRQGSDVLVFSFATDGSTTSYNTDIQIENGIVDVYIERYVTLIDSSIVLDRSLQEENVDYYIDNTNVIFYEPPAANATIIINYSSSVLLSVDYAVNVRFNSIDGMTREYVDSVLGGFDSSITVYDGKKIIFERQEQYPGYIGPDDGWVRNSTMWDDAYGWDDPDIGFDEFGIIPGYNENQEDPEIQNQRAGIWRVTTDDFGLIRLEFVQSVIPGQRVEVINGAVNGGKILRYGPTIRFDIGETVPKYSIISAVTRGIETIFDGGSTRFVENISVYQAPDEGDKYLVFPRVNIFA